MVSVAQAAEIIQSNLYRPRKRMVHLSNAVGRILADEILCDRDFPPFDRAAMDGIAIAYSAWMKNVRSFEIESIQAAGAPQQSLMHEAHCIEIMTGAMLPGIFDTVIRYEDVTIADGRATINIEEIALAQSVHRKGIDATKGIVLLAAGTVITSADVAIIASVGRSSVKVFDVGTVAVVRTGDELVAIDETPEPWQIRRSNDIALLAALKEINVTAGLFHVKDNKETLQNELAVILEQHDIIILSGGVSKGKFDYIPDALTNLGIVKQFHQVQQRPGKPFWFGRNKNKTVFALPGNPVSTYLCFHKYVRPWLLKGFGVNARSRTATLATDFQFKPNLTYFLQVTIENVNGVVWAKPCEGEGSGDFANLRNADGFIELPSERNQFVKGEVFNFIPFRQ